MNIKKTEDTFLQLSAILFWMFLSIMKICMFQISNWKKFQEIPEYFEEVVHTEWNV